MTLEKRPGDPVVVGVDGSPVADGALAWAVQAAAGRHASVRVIHSWVPPWSVTSTELATLDPHAYEEAARAVLDATVERARRADLPVPLEARLVRGRPAVALIEASATAQLLVVGSHGHRPVSGIVLGSVAQQVAAHAHGTVVLVPPGWSPEGDRHGRVVVGVDGSEPSYAALHVAAEEAGLRQATLEVVHVWDVPEPLAVVGWQVLKACADLQEASQDLLAKMTASLRDGGAVAGVPRPAAVECTSVRGHAAEVLGATAARADLLLVGSRGHGGFAGLVLGSVSQRCLHSAASPVAVVHPRAPHGRASFERE